MTISLHILADNASPDRLERAVLYLKRVRPRYVNIAGGSQLDVAMKLTERVRAEVPGIKVVFRHMKPEDTGIHTKMSASTLYNMKVAPHLNWYKKHEVIFMPDNESSGDDNQMRKYAQWEVEFAVLLHADKLRGAFARVATGNIGDGSHGSNQYPLLKDIFTAMLPGDMISPNEYSNAPGRSSGGHLQRYKQMWNAAGKPLETTIGEAGIAVNYDPGKGYRTLSISGAKYAQEMIDQEVWYESGKIDRFLYCIGGYGWESFQIGDDVLEHLEAYYASKQPPIDVTPPVPTPIYVPVPADLQGAETIMLQGAARFPLQAVPTADSKQNVGMLDNGDQVRIYRTSSTMADSLTFYWIERTSTPVGQSPYGWLVYHLLPPIIELPPPDTTAEGDIRRVAILTSQKESLQTEVRRLEQEIKAILSKYLPTLPETPQIAV